MAKGVMRSNKTRDGIAAILADNLGQVEEDVYDVKQEWEQQHSKFSEMEAAMEQAGLRLLNGPNLLKQNWWTNNSALGKNVVYGNDSRWSGTSYPYLSSYNSPTEYTQTTAPTAAELAECCAYYTTTEDGVTTYHLFKDEDDIRASVVDLATADQITELDDEVYAKAIQFDITANSAYGNAEWLMYCHPSSTRVYTQGDTKVSNYGQIEEMQPGRKYTMSFWARVLSGDGAFVRFGYGGNAYNAPWSTSTDGRSGISDYVEVKGSAWKRYSWTFEFNPTGDWYTETSAEVDGVTKITRSYNWYKKVCFGFCRKYTAVIQVCGFRLVEGNLWITDTYDDLDEGLSETKDRVTALETGTETTKNAILSIFAESDSATATANHAVGDLFVMGGKLYKATSAIATGETITPGTNCETTTVEELIAAAVAGIDLSSVPGNLTLGGKFIIGGSEYSGIKLLNMFNVVKKTMSNSLLGTTWQFVEAPDFTSLSSIAAAMMNNTADTMATCATAGVDMYGIKIMPAVSNSAIQYVTTSGTINAYDAGSYGWQHSSLRTIEFVAEPDTMPDEFLSWLLDNAILIS